MKKTVAVILGFFILLFPICAGAEEPEYLQLQLDGTDLSSWDPFVYEAVQDAPFSVSDANELLGKVILGREADLSGIFAWLTGGFSEQIRLAAKTVAALAAVALICAVLNHFSATFSAHGCAALAESVGYIAAAVLIFSGMTGLWNSVRETIDTLSAFVRTASPMMLCLLAAEGGTATAAVLQPGMIFITSAVSELYKWLIIPLTLCSAVFGILAPLEEGGSLQRLEKMASGGAKWVIGLGFTVFVGVLGIGGMTSSLLDGVSLRAAKYAVGTAIPVAGSMVGETIETVLGAGMIIKNASGVVGLITVAGIALSPILRLSAVYLCYRLGAALLLPISGKKIGGCLESMKSTVAVLLLTVVVSAIAFMITFALVLTAGNMIFTMRG